MNPKKSITAEEFDRRFDEGEDILEYCDLENIQRPNLETENMSIDFPKWMIHSLEKEAQRLGVPRQAIVKFWIAERLDLAKNAML